MTILHVTKKYPNALGGDAVVVSNLCKQQKKLGHDVAVVTSNCDDILNEGRIYKIGLRDTAAKLDHITPRRLLSLLVLFLKSFSIARRERPDVIHSHSIDMTFCFALAAWLHKIPLVHTFHIVTFYDHHQSLIRRKSELVLAKISRARIITAPNSFDVKQLRSAGFKMTHLLPNGVDLEFWKNPEKKRKGAQFTFVSVGRLESQKQYDKLLEATAKLAVSSDPFVLIIAGTGSLDSELKQLIQGLHLDGVVQLVGNKKPKEVRELLWRADAAVFTSAYETTPLTLLEAWAAGLPVISTEVGILRDTNDFKAAAYAVPVGDVIGLEKAMQTVMAKTGQRNVEGMKKVTSYAWPEIAKQAVKLYAEVL